MYIFYLIKYYHYIIYNYFITRNIIYLYKHAIQLGIIVPNVFNYIKGNSYFNIFFNDFIVFDLSCMFFSKVNISFIVILYIYYFDFYSIHLNANFVVCNFNFLYPVIIGLTIIVILLNIKPISECIKIKLNF